MPRWTTNYTIWIVILTVALLARLAAGAYWQSRLNGRQFYFGDSDSYWQLGRAIARGEPYEYLSPESRIFRTPGYPLLLSGLFVFTEQEPPTAAGRALSAVFGTVAVAVAGWWTTQLFDARAGQIAGWLVALYPGSVAMGTFVLSEAPFCPLMLAQLATWGMAHRSASWRATLSWAVAGGALAAAAVMMRPSWLLFTPFALAAGLLVFSNRRRQLIIGTVVCATLAAGMLPWWIRNARIAGHFVPTTLQVGASLYDGLSPKADGSSDLSFVPEIVAKERAVQPQPGDDIFEYRLDRRMTRAAVDWTIAHPGRAAELAWIKLVRIWNFWPNEPAFGAPLVRLGMLLTYVPLLVVSLVGVWRFTARGWPYMLAWLPAVYLTLLHMTFVGSIRYRELAMMALAVLAAGVLSGATRRGGTANAGSDAVITPEAK